MTDDIDVRPDKPPRVKAHRVRGRAGGPADKRVTVQGNLVMLRPAAEEAILGEKVPRATILGGAPLAHGLTAWTGVMGAGKSLGMGRQGILWANAGAEILVNRPTNIPGQQVAPDLRDISQYVAARALVVPTPLPDGASDAQIAEHAEATAESEAAWRAMPWLWIGLEELAIVANGREWQHFPMALAYAGTEQRKFKLAIMYTAVNWLKVDTTLRDLTTWVWHCRATKQIPIWPLSRWTGGSFHAQCRPPDWEQKDADEKPSAEMRWRPRAADIAAIPTYGDSGEVAKRAVKRRLAVAEATGDLDGDGTIDRQEAAVLLLAELERLEALGTGLAADDIRAVAAKMHQTAQRKRLESAAKQYLDRETA